MRAGLLYPRRTGLPARASGQGVRARAAAQRIIERFGYLQLDSIAISGARTQGLVLHSRLDGFDPRFAEELLEPGAPLFEYWGHEASWMPLDLYPHFAFRRKAMHDDRYVKKILPPRRRLAREVLKRIRDEGPLRSADLSSKSRMNGRKAAKYVASSLWLVGELAIRERRGFHRLYDLPERVIPKRLLAQRVDLDEAVRTLVELSLSGHGWAGEKTILHTFRITNLRPQARAALAECAVPCRMEGRAGWIREADLEEAAKLERARPDPERAVLLSPFDPVLWDRDRVRHLFHDFDQVLEIYKPAAKRVYGYYVLPVLAGDRLVARVDLKADRRAGRLNVLSSRLEEGVRKAWSRAALRSAVDRFAETIELAPAYSRTAR